MKREIPLMPSLGRGGILGAIVADATQILSDPPAGNCRVVNIYVDPITGKLVVEYEDTPS